MLQHDHATRHRQHHQHGHGHGNLMTMISTLLIIWCMLSNTMMVTSMTPLVGDGGYARYFDHEKADTLSFQWTTPPIGGASFEYWYPLNTSLLHYR
jgi:hypothetical protein